MEGIQFNTVFTIELKANSLLKTYLFNIKSVKKEVAYTKLGHVLF